ncbi:MAG TPA: hypothetical protein VFZ34_02140 [Blastocatellia bacterium]|nr:hypothetical protein [Blastocatellia bacterium]
MKNQIIGTLKKFSVVAVLALLWLGTSNQTFGQKPANDASIPPGLYSPLDKFLIEDAKPPLRLSDVSRTAQMLAWVTGGTFTNEQFEEFKQIIIAEWRTGNEETRSFITGWVAEADRLATIKKYADQIALKEKMLPGVIADLKKYPDDPKRAIVRRVYRRANGENSLGTFKAKPKVLKTSGTLKDVLGDWIMQTGAGVNMKTVKFSILANGKASFSDLQSAQKGNCFITQTLAKDGTVQVSEGTITLSFPNVQWQNIDSCQPTKIKNEKQSAETQQYAWQIKSDENEMRLLCLTGADGKIACYRKND